MNIACTASKHVASALAGLGRTEDVKFSPDKRRLAIAGFARNKILVVDIDIESSNAITTVSLTDCVEITSEALSEPHGLCFIDHETIIVANRLAWAPVLKVPRSGTGCQTIEAAPVTKIRGNPFRRVLSAGSVSVSRLDVGRYEVLICNSFVHRVTRHILVADGDRRFRVKSNEVLLRNGLEIPDGIAVSLNRRWIAISNHETHGVLLFENTPKLNLRSEAAGSLRKVKFPHGVCFTPDGSHLLVADSGAPFVHVYASDGDSWRGERDPIASYRIMDDDTFVRGRIGPQQGGPKGIDIHGKANIVVTTCEQQRLGFFDLRQMLSGYAATATE